MAVFTVSFSGTLDSKGRVTVPAEIRERLDLEKGDRVSLSLLSTRVTVKEVDSYSEALEFIQSLDSVESFSFRDQTLEVVWKDE